MWNWYKKLGNALRYLPTLLKVKRRVYGAIDAARDLYWLETVEAQLAEHKDRACLFFEKEVITCGQLLEKSYQVSRWAQALKMSSGDVVAINVYNCPMMIAWIIGLNRLGICCAMINTDLKKQALLHVIEVSGAKWIIVDDQTEKNVKDLSAKDREGLIVFGASGSFVKHGDLEKVLEGYSEKTLEILPRFSKKEVALYIFTSGTTGLPKAVKMSQTKLTLGVKASSIIMQSKHVGEHDRFFIALPLFHSTGLIVGLFPALNCGAQVVIARHFSASHFFEEAIASKSTAMMYIGEVFRYLTHQPPSALDKAHNIRLAIGNGLRPDVWPEVESRFGIEDLVEFYAATEGNVVLFNLDRKVGSVGWLWPVLFRHNGGHLIRLEADNETPVRDAQGFCVEATVLEAGELIGRIPKTDASQGSFDGYTDPIATEKKILRDVFEKGDQYFRTGDILRYDKEHYFYFLDRVGDTFRWKGHNVSTLEVSERLTDHKEIKEAMVYGIALKGYDGKMGMAAMVVRSLPEQLDDVFGSRLLEMVEASGLAEYQQPKFIRLVSKLEKTATSKYQRTAFAKEGIDMSLIKDAVYYYDHVDQTYLRLDAKRAKEIDAQRIVMH